MTRQLLTLVAAVVLVAGCGGGSDSESAEAEATSTTTTPTVPPENLTTTVAPIRDQLLAES